MSDARVPSSDDDVRVRELPCQLNQLVAQQDDLSVTRLFQPISLCIVDYPACTILSNFPVSASECRDPT